LIIKIKGGNIMKKLLLLLLALTVTLTVAACNGEDSEELIIFQNKIEISDALTEYAEGWTERTGNEVDVQSCGGSGCAYGDNLLAELQGNNQPDIFVIEGMTGFLEYQDIILEFEDADWADDTDLAFTYDGKVYGFPVSVEGWGLAYNVSLLDDFGIDPDDITSQADLQAAFDTIEANKADHDVDAAVSMAAGSGMTWVTGLHNFNGYLSAGLQYDDSSVIDDLNNGIVDDDRLEEYANWVEMLFDNSKENVLTAGDNYDAQLAAFLNEETVFLHQGNWVDPDIVSFFDDKGEEPFEMAYLPHMSVEGELDSLFIGAPSWYVINKNGNNPELAKEFLEDLAGTEEGHQYMVNEANMVPAFNSVTLTPSTPLSAELMEWMQAGKSYAWWQNDMPAGFGMNTLGPIYQLFANGDITKEQFIAQIKTEIEDIE
jgi:raffinose/stachyose/melibiose transport system substrate-binding protein